MSVKYKFRDRDKLHFVTFAVVYWIDLFTRNEYKDIMLESWKFCQNKKGLDIYAWCIMSSRVHMIIGTRGEEKAEDYLYSSAREYYGVKGLIDIIQIEPMLN